MDEFGAVLLCVFAVEVVVFFLLAMGSGTERREKEREADKMFRDIYHQRLDRLEEHYRTQLMMNHISREEHDAVMESIRAARNS